MSVSSPAGWRNPRLLPDGRVLALLDRDYILQGLSTFDKIMVETEAPVFAPLSILWSETIELGVNGVKCDGQEVDILALRCLFRAISLDKANIFDGMKHTYTESLPIDGWWLDIPDSYCLPSQSQDNGQAKILYFYLRGVYSRPRGSAPLKILIVGSSSGDRGGLSVFGLASILSVTNPGSTITAYDPFELSCHLKFNTTKVIRNRGVYPRGDWKWYDIVLDDSYLLMAGRADPWLPVPEGKTLATKSLEGAEQPYYRGNEKRFYSDPNCSTSLLYLPGFACACRDCKMVRPLCDMIPINPEFIAAAFIRSGIRPCSSLPLSKTYLAQGEIIAVLYQGNLFDCDKVEGNVKRYYRAAATLSAAGIGELSGSNIVLPRFVTPSPAIRKFTVKGFAPTRYVRPRFHFDDISSVFEGIPVNYGPYASVISAPSVPVSTALVAIIDDVRTLDCATPIILQVSSDPPRGYVSTQVECRVSSTTLHAFARKPFGPHSDPLSPAAVISSHLSAIVGAPVNVGMGDAPPCRRSLEVVRHSLNLLRMLTSYDNLIVRSKYYEDRGFVLPWNVYRPRKYTRIRDRDKKPLAPGGVSKARMGSRAAPKPAGEKGGDWREKKKAVT